MKKLALLLGLLTAAPAFASMSGSSNTLNSLGLDEIVNPTSIEMASTISYVNPLWGSGVGKHYVSPSYGRKGYWRSNPDGNLWNNKYYKW